MKLIFEQTEEDILDLNKYAFKRNTFIKVFAGIMILLIAFNFIVNTSKSERNLDAIMAWIVPILMIIVIYYFVFKFIIKKRMFSEENKKTMLGKREIEFYEDGFKLWTPVSETKYQWSAITKMEQSDKSYFLFLSKLQAILISKRAFNNEQEKRAFEQLVSTNINGK